MASIARKNLFEDIPRFLVAQAGIMFAVSLVTIQTGILNGFIRSTAHLVEQSDADLWVTSKDFLQLEFSFPIPLERLQQAQKVEGVAQAEPLLIRQAQWRSTNGKISPVRIYGFLPKGQLFANWTMLRGSIQDLDAPYSIIIDRANMNILDLNQVGDSGKFGTLPARLVGITEGTHSIVSGGVAFASLETANAYSTAGLNSSVNCVRRNGEFQCTNAFSTSGSSAASSQSVDPPRRLSLSDPITYVLVKVKPEQNLETVKKRLEEAMPDIQVLTKAEVADTTRRFWLERSGVGFVLGLGATVGVVVGVVVVSQILYASVSDHIREFGTLKAMGASDWVIYRVITEQALWMAVLGYIPSMALCLALAQWTMAAKGILILITPTMAAGVFGITVLMCVGSALFAIQKVTHVDPAIVFKA